MHALCKKVEKQNEQAHEIKSLRAENNALKQDLCRKDKALAETAALLIIKKKAHLIWGNYEDGLYTVTSEKRPSC